MRYRGSSLLVCAGLSFAAAAPCAATPAPYVRLDYGSSQLKMSDGNDIINGTEASFRQAGINADFHRVGSGLGPGVSAGFWLLPWFRAGATWSTERSQVHNRVHEPGLVYYDDNLDFRVTQIGAEAAVRMQRLAGLTFGGHVARAKAELFEGYAWEDYYGNYYHDMVAHRSRTVYGGFLGLDQTNAKGIAGFLRVGYQVREMGRLPGDFIVSDGVNSIQTTGETVPLDYSGIYVRAGIGYDFWH